MQFGIKLYRWSAMALLAVVSVVSYAGSAAAQNVRGDRADTGQIVASVTDVTEATVTEAVRQVLACQPLTDEMARLACFENAARQLDNALTKEPLPAMAAKVDGSVASDMARAAVAPAIANVPDAGEAGDTASVAPPKRGILPGWMSRRSGGTKKNKPAATVDITLTRIVRNNLGRHFFTTADGHVWKQTRISEIEAPSSLPSAAQLKRTFSGAIWLKITETGRRYPVLRVE